MNASIKFEVSYDPDARTWRAQTHCDCGSTFASDWLSTAQSACFEVLASLDEHQRRGFDGCGSESHESVNCHCGECKAHDRKLGAMVTR